MKRRLHIMKYDFVFLKLQTKGSSLSSGDCGESCYVVHSHNCGENVLQNVCVEMDDGLSASLLDINVLGI